MSESVFDDQIRYKYTHATAWDYTSQSPQLDRLRRQLEAEYDKAHETVEPVASPASASGTPTPVLDPDTFTRLARATVRNLLKAMEGERYITDADRLYGVMFPYDVEGGPLLPVPGKGDAMALDAFEKAWKSTVRR